MNGHDEAAFLERQQIGGPAARAFRENQERVAGADRRRATLDRSHRRFLVAAIDRDEAAVSERARENRDRVDLGLVENVQHGMQRVEQHRRIDVALMVRAVHGGAVLRHVLAADHPVADAAQDQPELHPEMAEHVQVPLRPEQRRDEHPRRRDDQHVEGNGDVGENGPDGRDEEHARGIINENARRTVRSAGRRGLA